MKNKGFTLIELLICIIIIGILAARVAPQATKLVGWGTEYSCGEHTGVITKLSKKGYIWKTWEGEMNLGGMSADAGGVAAPNAWRFSVDSDAVAQQLLPLATGAKRVTLVYTELYKTSVKQGETDYLIRGIKQVHNEQDNRRAPDAYIQTQPATEDIRPVQHTVSTSELIRRQVAYQLR